MAALLSSVGCRLSSESDGPLSTASKLFFLLSGRKVGLPPEGSGC